MRLGLRARILGAIGGGVLVTAACGGNAESDGGADASSDAVAGSGGASGGGGGSGGLGGSGGIGGTGGTGGTGGSTEVCLPLASLASRCSTDSCGEGWTYFCTSGGATWDPDAGVACPDVISGGCCESYTNPVLKNGACCYDYYANPGCGRPFVVGGRARHAEPKARADWTDASMLPASLDLDAGTRAALALAWLDDALMEHASIGSFSAFTLSLLSLAAPAELVASAQRAGVDEVEHARTCFALASRYDGTLRGPGPIVTDGACWPASLAEAAASAVAEGCVAETVAAAVAADQARVARDAAVVAALSRIADDEARHAELAWRFVAWALEEGGEQVERAVALAFERAIAEVRRLPLRALPSGVSEDSWHAHGRLTPAEEHHARRASLEEVVEPCARVLLARSRQRRGIGDARHDARV